MSLTGAAGQGFAFAVMAVCGVCVLVGALCFRFAIAGAGAMGGRFGSMLSTTENPVTFIDLWAQHVQAINDHGLLVHTDHGDERVHVPAYLPQDVHAGGVGHAVEPGREGSCPAARPPPQRPGNPVPPSPGHPGR